MELSELKLITASNIINLRTYAGMTQAQLGEKLNYTDKSISKWERGEAVPDAAVLLQMAELFDVSVDYILTQHDTWEPPKKEVKDDVPSYSANAIIAIAVIGTMTIALTVFVTLWMLDIVEWRVFPVGFCAAVIAYLVLDCVFRHGRHLMPSIVVLACSILITIYFFIGYSKWQILLLIVPAIVLVILSFKIRIRKPDILEKFKKH